VIGLDTNVLVRLLVRDDEEQHTRVLALLKRGVEEGHAFFVGDVVLAEVVWVLQARYRLSRSEVEGALRALLEAEHLTFESTDRCLRALRRFGTGAGGFSDYLIAERAADGGCVSLATFDRALLAEADCRAP
jgi:predicted nucleic-acid-binding protein